MFTVALLLAGAPERSTQARVNMVRLAMALERTPFTGDVSPVQLSPLSPVTRQLETFEDDQNTLVVALRRTSEGTARSERSAGPGARGGGGAWVNSLRPPLETQSGSRLSILPSPSLSMPSEHCVAGGGGGGGGDEGSLHANVSVDQLESVFGPHLHGLRAGGRERA